MAVRDPRARIEAAVLWLIRSPGASYRRASELHPGVTVDQLRSRINNRYGSLSAAQDSRGAHRPPAKWNRPCMRCRNTDKRPRGQYLCNRCNSADLHDGRV